jgi:hypothetical protein
MNKKTYTYLFILGTLLLVMLLPLFNYTVDRWRILHSDYNHYYAGKIPNKTFLKTKYLVTHPNQATTLLMGSSNGGYINANLIGENAYNMKYNFGLLAIHLQNLKVMLKEGVKIKTLWVGLNDYIIWKDPKDYEESFERSTYKANIWKDIETYMFYLFRQPDIVDWALFQGKYRLLTTDIISNPKPHLEAKRREDEHRKHIDEWSKHMAEADPILLHYTDTTYRIDEAVSEIAALKALCKTHNIKLTLFMYPVFYKAYLAYNQNKINEFKTKLAQVSDYYDFYRLNENAYDAIKWQDSMHFAYSMGNFIVKSIQNNQFLVTKKNVNMHLEALKKEALLHIYDSKKGILSKVLTTQNIIAMNESLNFFKGKKIFDLKDKHANYTKNNDFSFEIDDTITLNVTGRDPILILDSVHSHAKRVFLTLKINSSKQSTFKLYYKKSAKDNYSEKNTYIHTLHKGMNKLHLVLPPAYINNQLRVNFVTDEGRYDIETFMLHESKE